MVKKNIPVNPQCPVTPGEGCYPPSPIQPISPYVGVRSVNGRTGDIKLNTLTFGDKVYDGSDDKVLRASDLGLEFAVVNLGSKATEQQILDIEDAKVGDLYFCKENKLYYLNCGAGEWRKFPSKKYVDNIGGGKLKQAITTTVTVGGVEAGTEFAIGTDIESILRQMLMPEIHRTLVSIAITTPPTKVSYNVGETFNPAGMVVTGYYDDSTSEAVTGYTYSPMTPLTTADTTITVTYQGKTATQAITVKGSEIKVYHGASVNVPTTEAEIKALTLDETKSKADLLADGFTVNVVTNDEFYVLAIEKSENILCSEIIVSKFSLGVTEEEVGNYYLYHFDNPTTETNIKYIYKFEEVLL